MLKTVQARVINRKAKFVDKNHFLMRLDLNKIPILIITDNLIQPIKLIFKHI